MEEPPTDRRLARLLGFVRAVKALYGEELVRNVFLEELALVASSDHGREEIHEDDSSDLEEESPRRKVTKKKPFLERLYTDVNAEIQFLNKMLDYLSGNKVFPHATDEHLHSFSKLCLNQPNIASSELRTSISYLEKKYETRMRSFSSNAGDHLGSSDLEALRLGDRVWGITSTEIGTTDQLDGSKKGSNIGGEQDLSKYPFLRESMGLLPESCVDTVKKGLLLRGKSKMEELDRKWMELHQEEFEIATKREDLVSEQKKASLASSQYAPSRD